MRSRARVVSPPPGGPPLPFNTQIVEFPCWPGEPTGPTFSRFNTKCSAERPRSALLAGAGQNFPVITVSIS